MWTAIMIISLKTIIELQACMDSLHALSQEQISRSSDRIAHLEAALDEAMGWDWLTHPEEIPEEIRTKLEQVRRA